MPKMSVGSAKYNKVVEEISDPEMEGTEGKIVELKIVNMDDDMIGITETTENKRNRDKQTNGETNGIKVKETQSKYINTKRLRPRMSRKVLDKVDNLRPTKRAKTELDFTKDEKKTKSKNKWTKTAKSTLLAALKKHGPNQLSEISKMLPDIPLEVIKTRIFTYEVLAEYYYEDDLINKWMKCGICRPGDSCVSEALLFIKLLENHPLPSESKFDYREIYNFLHHTCCAEKQPFPELEEQNRDMLLSLISKVDANIYPKREKEMWDYLGKVYPKRHIRHVYPGKKNHYNI